MLGELITVTINIAIIMMVMAMVMVTPSSASTSLGELITVTININISSTTNNDIVNLVSFLCICRCISSSEGCKKNFLKVESLLDFCEGLEGKKVVLPWLFGESVLEVDEVQVREVERPKRSQD